MNAFDDLDDPSELPEFPAIPPRSQLYSLEPMGLGTGMVESLTSYIARLGSAHNFKLSTFVSKLLAPLSKFTGVSLSKVKKLYLGVDNRDAPANGGTGMIYIDDIQVTRP